MAILNYILLILLFCLTPAGVLWLCRKYPVLDKIGPIMILYGIGLIVGNLPGLPGELDQLQDIVPNVMVPLAIPMMLYGCNFSRQETSMQLRVIISGFTSVCIAVIGGYLLFGTHLDNGREIGGIISGMYTGGTVNAAALQTIFRIDSEDYLMINSYDIIISFIYFVFLFAGGIRLFRFLYGEKTNNGNANHDDGISTMSNDDVQIDGNDKNSNPYKGLFTKKGLRILGKILLVTIAIVGVSAGVAVLLPESWFMVVFILLLTTLGVVCSFIRPIRTLPYSYDIGMYLIYIFSLVIATMADLSSLDLAGGLYQIGFMSFAVFVSLFLHAIICRIMRVDADSMMLSSVAFINSPPFVPMAAAAMRNRKALVTGLGAGIAGYAIGNHFGVLMAHLLSLF